MCDSKCSELASGQSWQLKSSGNGVFRQPNWWNMPTLGRPGRQSIQTLFMLLLAFLSQALGLPMMEMTVACKLGNWVKGEKDLNHRAWWELMRIMLHHEKQGLLLQSSDWCASLLCIQRCRRLPAQGIFYNKSCQGYRMLPHYYVHALSSSGWIAATTYTRHHIQYQLSSQLKGYSCTTSNRKL